MRNPYDFDDEYSGTSMRPRNTTTTTPVNNNDEAIQGTNNDAVSSRLSAALRGYIQDDFIRYFSPLSSKSKSSSPLINRGSFIRYKSIQSLIGSFVNIHGSNGFQVVSLGAGSDTRFFTLASSFDILGQNVSWRYFEIDFSSITRSKVAVIHRTAALRDIIGQEAEYSQDEIHSERYHLISGDLREWDQVIVQKLLKHGLDVNLPTIFISECVLVYLEPQYSDKIISWTASHFSEAAFVTYEQIIPNDPFGRVMISNLKMRNVELKGIFKYPTLETQETRYLSSGWEKCFVDDMNNIFNAISADELDRVNKIEMLDELEEWTQLMKHYHISFAMKGQKSCQINFIT